MKSEKLKTKRDDNRHWWIDAAGKPAVFYFSLLVFNFSLFTITVSGQGDGFEYAPPPLKIVSKDELARLDAKTDFKDRTKLALELMDLRLDAAERLFVVKDFEGTYRELGVFHGLMDNAIGFLQRRDSRNGSGKILDNFKRIDLALRTFAPRLEGIRREVPLRYEDYVRRLLKYLREARTQATEPLFADTVVPQRKLEKKPDQ